MPKGAFGHRPHLYKSNCHAELLIFHEIKTYDGMMPESHTDFADLLWPATANGRVRISYRVLNYFDSEASFRRF